MEFKIFFALFTLFSFRIQWGLTRSLSKNDKDDIQSHYSVLHSNLQYMTLNIDEGGKVAHDIWTPSPEDKRSLKHLDVNRRHSAELPFPEIPNPVGAMNRFGVVGTTDQKEFVLSESASSIHNRSDYIDLGLPPLTYSSSFQLNEGLTKGVVELLLVVDKEFGDVFNHDRQKILEYLTVFFWDVNLRYKSLPSVDLSIRITGIVAINDVRNQPFIEDSRAPDGRTELTRIIYKFASWLYSEMTSFPKFDVAVGITNSRSEWNGGLAFVGTACRIDNYYKSHWGTAVLTDDGSWGGVTVATHEIGHVLGAPHDDQAEYPGGCQDRGYIMSGASEQLQWFFSRCSDRTIRDYVTSVQGSCLRQIDHMGELPISPDYSSVEAPPMSEQCKLRLDDPTAFTATEDTGNCARLECRVPTDRGYKLWHLGMLDNTPCIDGRCFRGRCLQPFSFIINLESEQCLKMENSFQPNSSIIMVPCDDLATPLDKFLIKDGTVGNILSTPYQSLDARDNGDACVSQVQNVDGALVEMNRCNVGDLKQGWNFIPVGNNSSNGQFLLKNRYTGHCAKQVGNVIRAYLGCNESDFGMRWKVV